MQPCGPPTVFPCPAGRISAYRPHSHTRAARTPGAWRARTHKTPGRPRHSKQRATERARVPYRPRLRCVRLGPLRAVRSWKHCVDLKASHEVPPGAARVGRARLVAPARLGRASAGRNALSGSGGWVGWRDVIEWADGGSLSASTSSSSRCWRARRCGSASCGSSSARRRVSPFAPYATVGGTAMSGRAPAGQWASQGGHSKLRRTCRGSELSGQCGL